MLEKYTIDLAEKESVEEQKVSDWWQTERLDRFWRSMEIIS